LIEGHCDKSSLPSVEFSSFLLNVVDRYLSKSMMLVVRLKGLRLPKKFITFMRDLADLVLLTFNFSEL